jgi:hypothetical protein
MKKFVIAGLAVLAVVGAAAPAQAEAATCGSISSTDYNRSGYGITYSRAHTTSMNCASVRYAMHEFRAKVKRQHGYPRMTLPFFDGWVTWHCYKTSRVGVRCYENTSDTSYSFRTYVW